MENIDQFSYPFWAKKSDKDGVFMWLPLDQHLLDTMNIIALLWEHWLSLGQKKLIISSIDTSEEEEAKRFTCFLGGAHDLGKAIPSFQSMKGYKNSPDLDAILIERLEASGFTDLSKKIFPSTRQSHHSLASQTILRWHGVENDITTIIGGHHGKPIDSINILENQTSYFSNYYQIENSNDSIHLLWKKAQSDILSWLLDRNGYASVNELPNVNVQGQVILSGLLIMADWIASNEYYFPLIPIDLRCVPDKEKRLIDGWSKWQKTNIWEPQYLTDITEEYQKRFGFEPRKIQKSMYEVLESTEDPGVVILEAPMGIGKTEAALMAVEQLAYKTGSSGVFFGLPTQATSDGIFPRLIKWLNSVSQESGDNLSARLVHGKAALNSDFTSLASNINIDEYTNSRR